MRLKERELTQAFLVKRVHENASLGSCPEAFSPEKIPFRASLLPEDGELRVNQYGLKSGAKIRLLAANDLAVKVGDGVYAADGFYIVQTVNRWSAHQEIICGARA